MQVGDTVEETSLTGRTCFPRGAGLGVPSVEFINVAKGLRGIDRGKAALDGVLCTNHADEAQIEARCGGDVCLWIRWGICEGV